MARSPKWAICPECRGNGTHVHHALSVWTEEDRRNDPDAFEEMRNGRYDVTCERCGGSGKIDTRRDDYNERLADARLAAMEDGDAEGYYNPRLRM